MHNNIMAAGSRDRPPMLATGRYAQWRSRFLRYIDTRPNGDALRKCISQMKSTQMLSMSGQLKKGGKPSRGKQGESLNISDVKTNFFGVGQFTSHDASVRRSDPEQGQKDKDYAEENLALIAKLLQETLPNLQQQHQNFLKH
ncbi:hypothetical protein Tco_0605957 [Tanacetum coccineum]